MADELNRRSFLKAAAIASANNAATISWATAQAAPESLGVPPNPIATCPNHPTTGSRTAASHRRGAAPPSSSDNAQNTTKYAKTARNAKRSTPVQRGCVAWGAVGQFVPKVEARTKVTAAVAALPARTHRSNLLDLMTRRVIS